MSAIKGEYLYQSASRDHEDPPEAEPKKRELPIPGVCPWCREDLEQVGPDTISPVCNTKDCKYDDWTSEESNRERYLGESDD